MLTQKVAQEIMQFVFHYYENSTPEEIMAGVEKILLQNNVKLTIMDSNGVFLISPIYEIISWFILYYCDYEKTNNNFFSVADRKMVLCQEGKC